ncbi:hypothetical protein ASE72_02205 [Sphingomonas sp. Leaf20]|nr:hypothetical protein ASE72_02205 [Sphingomonas sp. Leaf20]
MLSNDQKSKDRNNKNEGYREDIPRHVRRCACASVFAIDMDRFVWISHFGQTTKDRFGSVTFETYRAA